MTHEVFGYQYLSFVREERQFAFLLAHLLLRRGPRLDALLALVNEKLPAERHLVPSNIQNAEVYVEFARLRDEWDSLVSAASPGRPTLAERRAAHQGKRARLIELLKRAGLAAIASELPDEPSAVNARFMGAAGARIINDIASPALWSVASIMERFGRQPEVALNLCRLKWSFRIKPDIVILAPGMPCLCIEAKLVSVEGRYPVGNEARLFDQHNLKRVGQVDLQRFMFEDLLGQSCQTIVIQRDPSMTQPDLPTLSWGEVLSTLMAVEDVSDSIPFVGKILSENESLQVSYSRHRIHAGG